MEERDALEDIRGYASAGRIHFSSHGRARMSKRGVTYADVQHALTNAKACEEGANGRWKVCSTDIEGEELNTILLFLNGLLVVTVY